MTPLQSAPRHRVTPVPPTPKPLAKSVGYSVLRAGEGPDSEVCLLVPHVNSLRALSLDAISKSLELDAAGARLALTELPSDVVTLLAREPRRVLLVSVDTLSRPQYSARADEILVTRH